MSFVALHNGWPLERLHFSQFCQSDARPTTGFLPLTALPDMTAEQFMPLVFRGTAILDSLGQGLRFAGCAVTDRPHPLVICEVSGEALRVLSGQQNAAADQLLELFEQHKATICAIASERFDTGEYRPLVTSALVRAQLARVQVSRPEPQFGDPLVSSQR